MIVFFTICWKCNIRLVYLSFYLLNTNMKIYHGDQIIVLTFSMIWVYYFCFVYGKGWIEMSFNLSLINQSTRPWNKFSLWKTKPTFRGIIEQSRTAYSRALKSDSFIFELTSGFIIEYFEVHVHKRSFVESERAF